MWAEEVALPPPGTTPMASAAWSPSVRDLSTQPRQRMLLGAGEVDWDKYDSIVPFQANELKDRRNLLRLCTRMWEAGMLTYVPDPQAHVSFFAVVKKVEEQE